MGGSMKSNGFSVRCVKKNDATTLDIQSVLIPAGTFTMGSPTTEVNRDTDETQHLSHSSLLKVLS